MTIKMPAISLLSMPGRSRRILEIAKKAEQKGFEGVYVPSFSATIPFCQSILEATSRIEVATSIQPIYFYNPRELAKTAAYMHEVGNGRFRLGLGVSHEVMRSQFGVADRGQSPLGDMHEYLKELREAETSCGELPPILLATLRSKMLALATENASGAIWANAARSYLATQLREIPKDVKANGFKTAAMIVTTVSNDEKAAAEVNKKSLNMYLQLPNYRNYWKAAGFLQQMLEVESAIVESKTEDLASVAGERWLADVTLYGCAAKVREGLEAWYDAGVDTPILVPASTSGGLSTAAEEVMAIF